MSYKQMVDFFKSDPVKYKRFNFIVDVKMRWFADQLKTHVGRPLVNQALQGACQLKDLASVTFIVEHIKQEQIIAHIEPIDVKFLALS
jgi:hypothetical protein